MNSYQIEIVEPTAVGILEEMERNNLIKIRDTQTKERLQKFIEDLRSATNTPSLEEITKEVETVRKNRYERSRSKG